MELSQPKMHLNASRCRYAVGFDNSAQVDRNEHSKRLALELMSHCHCQHDISKTPQSTPYRKHHFIV